MKQSIRMQGRRGSVILLAIILTSAIAVSMAGLLKFGLLERRLNESHIEMLHARNAAESMLEYGFAELKFRFQRKTSFAVNELRVSPLRIPSSAQAFFNDTEVVFDELELVGGDVPDLAEYVYVDPADPANAGDPQKGKWVLQREVEVYGRGVSEDPILGRREAFARQVLVVRDAHLFAHAIFYNMDLEFHPGPSMDMHGPVHSNGDLWVQAVNRLSFYSTVTAHGDILYGYKPQNKITQSGDVRIRLQDDSWVSFYDGSGSKTDLDNYFDSRDTNWRSVASTRWEGQVGSRAHDVPNMVPPGIGGYVADMNYADGYTPYNPAFAMIEPQLQVEHPYFKGWLPETDADYQEDWNDGGIQREQFSYKAGLVIKVTPTDPSDIENTGVDVEFYKWERSNASDPSVRVDNAVSARNRDSDGNLVRVPLAVPPDVVKFLRYKEDTSASGQPPIKDFANGIGGFYDQRQKRRMHMVYLDVGKLKEAVETADTFLHPTSGANFHANPSKAGDPLDWNGVVYVEMPYLEDPEDFQDEIDSSDYVYEGRTDRIVPAEVDIDELKGRDQARDYTFGLMVANGAAGNIPDPDFLRDKDFEEFDRGFTLATNGQMYLVGHYNADGKSSTGQSTYTDMGSSHSFNPDGNAEKELPCALVADSITVLSQRFIDDNYIAKSKGAMKYRDATFTEVSAAFLTGLAPTIPGIQASGGAHNFPRFLEDWSGKEFRYRGSMVAMFESEAGKNSMNNYNWYSPPTRNWGFNTLFRDGHYPPGTPMVRDFRQTQFEFLTAEEYDTALSALAGFSPSSDPRGHY